MAVAQTLVALIAKDAKCSRTYDLHHLCYAQVRAATGLGANMVCIAIRRVAGAYKTLRSLGRAKADEAWPALTYSAKGSVRLDARTFSLKGDEASLWSKAGRQVMPMVLAKRQRRLLASGKVGGADVVCKRGKWFLHVMMNMPTPKTLGRGDTLGVDVGENTLAATSNGRIFGGEALRHQRDVWLAYRRRLQSNGSKSAKQRLCKASGRENRHVRHVNHVESRRIVTDAQLHGCSTIGMEQLTHIRQRIKMCKRMRARLHRWAWRQLQSFVEYKAQGAGVQVVYVDPAYTSQTCADCLCLGTRRKHLFSCQCGSLRHADSNAAKNIRRLAMPIGTATRYVTAGHVALLSSGAA